MSATPARQWASAAELAGLPGMPQTKSAVIRRAASAQWAYLDETGRGGTRRVYAVQHLPAVTRAALAWSKTSVVAGDAAQAAHTAGQLGAVEGAKAALQVDVAQQAGRARQAAGLVGAGRLPAKAQARMDAKLQVLSAFELYVAETGHPLSRAEHDFAAAYRLGTVPVPAAVRKAVPNVSSASLQRWRLDVKARGITALAGAYGNRKGASKVSTQLNVREFVTAMLVKFPHARATHVLQALQARMRGDLAEGTVQLPSAAGLARWIKEWRHDNADLIKAIADPDGWKNKYMVAFGSQSEGVVRLNQRWELDSSPADVMCSDGRHSLLGVIDVASRRVRLLISKTSKASAVAALIRRALLDWGVPEEAKTDNGSDYVSNHITRVFTALDVKHTLCPPFQPWHKPHIERFFGTFTRGLAELLPGFIGHNVAQRSAIEARKSFADRLMKRGEVVEVGMSSAELQAVCDRWVDDIYMHNPHGGLKDATPFQATAALGGEEVRRIGDERALDVLLAAAPENNGRRTVQKKGIRLDEAWFIAPELESWVGNSVQVRFDEVEHDLVRISANVTGDFGSVTASEPTLCCAGKIV